MSAAEARSTAESLEIFVSCLKVPDPRSPQGASQPFLTAVTLVFLGLLAHRSTIAAVFQKKTANAGPKFISPNSASFFGFDTAKVKIKFQATPL